MKTKFLLLAFCFLSLFGCETNNTNTDGDCTFEIATIINGTALGLQESEWDCLASNRDFRWALFENGTGIDSELGQFTWTETGCGQIEYSTVGGAILINNLEGSLEEQELFFTFFTSGDIENVSCLLSFVP